MKHFLQLILLIVLQLNVHAQTTYFVDAGNVFFTPSVLVINQGDIVEWNNVGGVHNVNGTQATYPLNAESFTSGAPSGAAWTYQKTFTVVGVNEYMCDVHGAGMSGSITVNGPLPVELKSITTFVNQSVCKVEWKTDKEENLKDFTLQKSKNALDFTDVITLAANHVPSTYSYMDDMGAEQYVYYRVKIADENNSVKYTPIRLAQNDLKITKNKLAILPNPYVDHFHVSVQSVGVWSGVVAVYDFTGRTLYKQDYTFKEGNNYIHLENSDSYPKGIYIVSVQNRNKQEVLSEKVVKQ